MNQSKFSLLLCMPVLLVLTLFQTGCDQSNQEDSSQTGNKADTASPVETVADQPSQESKKAAAETTPEQSAVSPAPSTITDTETNPSTDEMQASAELYQVVDGNKLDEFSYEGFKLYRNWCARCHGTYGQGMVGPNLAESLNIISKEQFVEVVTHGKTGQIGSMPAWESNQGVMNGMDNLYAYLKARADGAIGEVKPTKQK
ncbi:c-type cytochrome [Methylophaga sp.]|uniref:c-type cytochrome n=1 Tax=Methylophaga sp. TaxID=2024840 RepID=UPI003F69D171